MAADGRGARVVSLSLAALVALVLALNPAKLGDGATVADRIALALALVGAVGGISHGIGHRGERRMLRHAAAPRMAWPLMLAGAAWLAFSGF